MAISYPMDPNFDHTQLLSKLSTMLRNSKIAWTPIKNKNLTSFQIGGLCLSKWHLWFFWRIFLGLDFQPPVSCTISSIKNAQPMQTLFHVYLLFAFYNFFTNTHLSFKKKEQHTHSPMSHQSVIQSVCNVHLSPTIILFLSIIGDLCFKINWRSCIWIN